MAARQRRFLDRAEAGGLLAEVVTGLVRPPVLVLGIPRGGVVVAARVAARLGAPLDVVVPRKVGAPGNPELAVGAVADGVQAIDQPAIRRLGLDMAAVRAEVARQTAEVTRRTAAYRQGLPPLELAGRTVVLVDDGVATGWTCAAAASCTRRAGAARVVVAVPVGPPGLAERLSPVVDEVAVLVTPDPYLNVGQVYERFPQVDDEEVLRCLQEGRAPTPR
ncbi:MAG TPA: phosphoribosyltransferase family protein [Actinomycetota bacterium]|jgi:putative phosphoribosyl transferase|nr:phosphoribosyltransferase family protein [Actinomycetota bacterium]